MKVCWLSGTGKGHTRRSKWDVEGRSRQQCYSPLFVSTGDEDSQEAFNNSRKSARGSEQAARLTESHARMGPFKATCHNSFF